MSILKTLKAKSMPAVSHVISMAEQFASEHDEDLEIAPSLSEQSGHRKDGVPYAFVSYFPDPIRSLEDISKADVKQKKTETLLQSDILPYVERVRIAESTVHWLKSHLIKNPKQPAKILDTLCRTSDQEIIKACLSHPNISVETLEYLIEEYGVTKGEVGSRAQNVLNRISPQKMAA